MSSQKNFRQDSRYYSIFSTTAMWPNTCDLKGWRMTHILGPYAAPEYSAQNVADVASTWCKKRQSSFVRFSTIPTTQPTLAREPHLTIQRFLTVRWHWCGFWTARTSQENAIARFQPTIVRPSVPNINMCSRRHRCFQVCGCESSKSMKFRAIFGLFDALTS